ncbi:MAG: hypothetical protein R2789_01680 [Microthrixaceae bacterium]
MNRPRTTLRFAYDSTAESGRWERTCLDMVGGPPEVAQDASSALDGGSEVLDLPDEVPGIQLALDSTQQCATGADLAGLHRSSAPSSTMRPPVRSSDPSR